MIAICRPTGGKWQLKTLFLVIFDSSLLIVKSVFDCLLPGVIIPHGKGHNTEVTPVNKMVAQNLNVAELHYIKLK